MKPIPHNNLLGCSTVRIQHIYWVNFCSTHKYKIPSCGISQIDVLEAGKITYEDHSLLVIKKFVKTTLGHQIMW